MEFFSIVIQFAIKDLNEHFVEDFYRLLNSLGFYFVSGYWKAEEYTFHDLISINQRYLEESQLEDRYKYDVVEDGFQYNGLFKYHDFTFIRGYWDVYNDVITFNILLPEDTLYRFDNRRFIKNKKRMKDLIDLSIGIWEKTNAKIIQTGWECSRVPADYTKIRHSVPPQAEPFAIISRLKYDREWYYYTTEIGRCGILMEDDENWNPL